MRHVVCILTHIHTHTARAHTQGFKHSQGFMVACLQSACAYVQGFMVMCLQSACAHVQGFMVACLQSVCAHVQGFMVACLQSACTHVQGFMVFVYSLLVHMCRGSWCLFTVCLCTHAGVHGGVFTVCSCPHTWVMVVYYFAGC